MSGAEAPKEAHMRSVIAKAGGLLLLIGGTGLCLWNTSWSATPESNATVPSQLAKDLMGTWILVGEPGNVSAAPTVGGRLKMFTARYWCITQADPTNGITIYHHGGTYTLSGDHYAETVEYANENTRSLIGKVFTFTIKVDGDTLTQVAIDNPWTEVWKRAE
jgi:hypothetical protein